MTMNFPMPSPSDIAYIDRGVYMYIVDVLREKRVSYDSPHCDLIYNEIVKDLQRRICSSIKPK